MQYLSSVHLFVTVICSWCHRCPLTLSILRTCEHCFLLGEIPIAAMTCSHSIKYAAGRSSKIWKKKNSADTSQNIFLTRNDNLIVFITFVCLSIIKNKYFRSFGSFQHFYEPRVVKVQQLCVKLLEQPHQASAHVDSETTMSVSRQSCKFRCCKEIRKFVENLNVYASTNYNCVGPQIFHWNLRNVFDLWTASCIYIPSSVCDRYPPSADVKPHFPH